MHYGVIAIGSRGDVQPYIALALGLMERGHEATILAHENFKQFVEGFGVAFVPLKGNVEEMLQSDEGLRMLRKGNIVAFSRYLKKITKKTGESIAVDMFQACSIADVLIASLLALPWVDAIPEKLGKPWALVQLDLPTVPTKTFPMAALDIFNFPAYNVMTYRLYAFAYHQSNKKLIHDFRKSLDLPQLKSSLLKKIADEKILNLHCFSPTLLARLNDWTAQNDITGFLFLPDTTHNYIPVELNHWLANGDKIDCTRMVVATLQSGGDPRRRRDNGRGAPGENTGRHRVDHRGPTLVGQNHRAEKSGCAHRLQKTNRRKTRDRHPKSALTCKHAQRAHCR
jgi:sterol 3beta-glucosyltransferase